MKRRLVLLIMALCFVFLSVPSAFAANIVTMKANGAKSIHADAEHLAILNNLYGTRVTYKQVIEQVYPDAINNIPADVLKQMDKVLVDWSAGYTNNTSATGINTEISDSTVNTNNAPKADTNTALSNSVSSIPQLSSGGSTISGSRSMISYGGDTEVFPGTVPYMNVLTYLYAGTTRGNIDSSFDEEYNVNTVNSYGAYYSPSSGTYQAKSTHFVRWSDGGYWFGSSASNLLKI